jgi:hypothetical protein
MDMTENLVSTDARRPVERTTRWWLLALASIAATGAGVAATLIWNRLIGAAIGSAAAAAVMMVPQVLQLVHHALAIGDCWPRPVAESGNVANNTRQYAWLGIVVVASILLSAAMITLAKGRGGHGESDLTDGKNTPAKGTHYLPPEYAGTRWVFDQPVPGHEAFETTAILEKGLERGSPVEVEGLTSGPIKIYLVDEFANPAEGWVLCADHGMWIGKARLSFSKVNTIDVEITFVDGTSRRSTFKRERSTMQTIAEG